jgi:hypothetical protein
MTSRMRGGHARCAGTRAIGIALGLLAAALVASPPASADDLAAQRAAAHQLVGGQLDTGLLEFDMDFLAGTGAGSGKSIREKTAFIARQAAAAYGIAKYYEQTRDERVAAPLVKLIQALGDLSLPVGKSGPQRIVESAGVLSLPFLRLTLRNALSDLGLLYTPAGDGALIAYGHGYATTWAGATAMALMAELHFFRAKGDNRFASLRARWQNGLGALRVPGKGFREYPASIDESAYANGEAWLAYAILADTFAAGPVPASDMHLMDEYMMATYAGPYNEYFFHWGAMAAARRFLTTKDARFADFLEKQMQTALDGAPPVDSPHNSCALVEGLAAGAAALARAGRADSALAVHARIGAEMEKNRALQLPPARDRIALGGDIYLISPRLGAYAGAYLLGRYTPTIRVDVTHHCISAITEMQQR